MKIQKSNLVLLSLIGIAFLTLYSILSWNNRLPYEDYTFISITKGKGVINAMLEVYNVYSARWSAHTCAFFFSQFYQNKLLLPIFNIATLATVISSFYLLFVRIFISILAFNIKKNILLLYSILFTSCLFFSSYDIGQTWFWYMVNWMYLWSIIAGNFLLWILISGKAKPIQIPFIIILTAYIAGAAESYAMIYILLFLTIIILKRKKIFSIAIDRIRSKSLIISTIFLIAFYLITVFAPGTWARKDLLTHATFTQHIVMVAKGYGIVILRYSPKLIPYLILFGVPWMILGSSMESSNQKAIKQLLTTFIKSGILIGILILVLIFPASWILYDPPPPRALSQVSLLLCIYSSFIFFCLGYKIQLPESIKKYVPIISLMFCISIIGYQIIKQASVTRTFSKEYDNRIELVKQEKSACRSSTLFIDSLPPSGMLYSDKLSKDSLRNDRFETAYDLNFHVARK